MAENAPARSGPSGESFDFSFDGMSIRAYAGDTIADALTRAGVRVFSRSMKFHRPRGLFCGSGRCNLCSMRVDGVPDVRTCSTLAAAGMTVRRERGYPSANHDVFSVFDRIFSHGFDYRTRFIRPAFMTPMYQRLVRRLASSSELPGTSATFEPIERKKCDTLIVGQGISGSVAQARIRGRGVRSVISVDRGAGDSAAIGFYEDGWAGILQPMRLQLVKAKTILIATGRYELGLPLPGGDLPGNMLPGAIHQLLVRGIRPGRRAAVVGHNSSKEITDKEFQSLGVDLVAEVLEPSRVVRVLGRKMVSGLEIRVDGGAMKKVQCDIVLHLGPQVPAVEFAQQAGCELVSNGDFWCVRTDPEGLTSQNNIYACGGVTGLSAKEDRIASGLAAGDAIVRSLGVT